MKNILTLLLIAFAFSAFAQPLYFSFPFPLSGSTTGNVHPRIALVNENPIIVWGDVMNDNNLMYSHWNGNGFDAPVQLTYDDEMVMLGYAEGPVIQTHGDTVYICYVSMGMNENRVYLRKSTDGGQNFSDTILVNDRSLGTMLEYASMSLDENGNPFIAFIRTENGNEPKYVLYRSLDGGNTFTNEINITTDTSSQPCECCPAALSIENNRVYCTYRNNIGNIRDFYVSVSENGGNSFDSLSRIDTTNWFAATCPASGASSTLSGDSLISVFMNKENNRSMIMANSLHKTNLVAGPHYIIDTTVISGTFTMNYPEIAGSGDTIGIVWQDNRTGQIKTYISASTSGLSGLSAPQLVSDFTGTFHHNPHLVFNKGIFHITWRDFGNNLVWYRKASFSPGIASADESDNRDIRVFPNPAKDFIQILNENNSCALIEIHNMEGKSIYSGKTTGPEKINTGDFAPGVYQISFTSDLLFHSKKLIIQK